MRLAVLVLSLLCVSAAPLPHHLRNRARAAASVPPAQRARHAARMRSWAPPRHTLTSAWAPLYPAAYGADPTGQSDSTAAFAACLRDLLARNTSGHADESGTTDLGGATMDLQGGDYLISAPLVFPSNFSNYGLVHGTLRASATFPRGAFLVEVGTFGSFCENWGDSCTEDANLEDLLLDGSGVAGGGVRFNAVIGVNAGPDLFVVNFTDKGVVLQGGHEVLLHESWVGSCWYTPPGACWLNATALGNSTGIWVNGNDHYITNTIVFAAQSGIVVDGAANILTAVHTWNTQSGSVPAAAGIRVNVWQNRLISPYLDYVPLVLQGAAMTTITGAFFLGGAQLIFLPHPSGYPVQGVVVTGSQYAGSGDVPDVVALDAPPGFTGLQDVTITGAMSDSPTMPRRSTVCTLTQRAAPPPWVFDFTPCLAFNATRNATAIQTISVAAVRSDLSGPPFLALADAAAGGVVTVRAYPTGAGAGLPAHATVTVTVDQSTRPRGGT